MSFSVVPPPKDTDKFAEVGKQIVEAALSLGINLDTEGFLYTWLAGTRVLIQRDGDKIVSMALMVSGRRWVSSDDKATVLAYAGDKEGILGFSKTIAEAMGASALIYEETDPLETTPEYQRHIVREIFLG